MAYRWSACLSRLILWVQVSASQRVHARKGFFRHKKIIGGKRESMSWLPSMKIDKRWERWTLWYARQIINARTGGEKGVCVFFTWNHYFCPSTSSTTSVRTDSSILEEIQVMCSHKGTPQRYFVATYLVCSEHSSGQCNAMSSYWKRQARHGHPMKYRNEREQWNNKNEEDNSNEKKKRK